LVEVREVREVVWSAGTTFPILQNLHNLPNPPLSVPLG